MLYFLPLSNLLMEFKNMNPKIQNEGCPTTSLEQAIERVRQVADIFATTPADREAVVNVLGYAGMSGAAQSALSNLQKYGLLERAEKGKLRVSALANDILFTENLSDKLVFLARAAAAPTVFEELDAFFTGSRPPTRNTVENSLRSKGFTAKSARKAASAYLKNREFLESTGAVDRSNALDKADKENRIEPIKAGDSKPETRLKVDETEWLRVHVSENDIVRVLVTRPLDVQSIDRLMTMLQAQRSVLADRSERGPNVRDEETTIDE